VGDDDVVRVLSAFYNKYDPGSKTATELHAISCKYSGKEDRLYQSLSEKYGEHPVDVAARSSTEPAPPYGEGGGGGAGAGAGGLEEHALFATLSQFAQLAFERVAAVAGALLVALLLFHMFSLGAFRWVFPASQDRTVLLLGSSGNVGSGIAAAFRSDSWKVVGVDQAYRRSQAFDGDDDSFASTTESLPDGWLRQVLSSCSFIIYAAEPGNRDDYAANPELGQQNNERFRRFCDRVCELQPTISSGPTDCRAPPLQSHTMHTTAATIVPHLPQNAPLRAPHPLRSKCKGEAAI
jgi:hypothetical protein